MTDTATSPGTANSHAPARRLFVYGTLRRGGSNDIARLVPEATFIVEASMRGRLYDLGEYPALVADENAGWVAGEIYAVPDSGWPALDALEEIVTPERPAGYYFRIVAKVRIGEASDSSCEVYVANPATLRLDRLIECNDWMKHAAHRVH